MDEAVFLAEYDYGQPLVLGSGTIGNRVWHDLNQNGLDDNNEPGIAGVSLVIWRDSDGDAIPDWQGFGGVVKTDENGYYSFSGLKPGNYIVFVWSVNNWGPGQPLEKFVSTNGLQTDVNNDEDKDNNGFGEAFSDILSGIVTLTAGGEPLNDGDRPDNWFDYDPSGNMTVDFGFYVKGAAVLASCDDAITDTGGAIQNYKSNENVLYNICPNSTDKHVVISFDQFEVDPTDALYVYDGPTTNSPLIVSSNPATVSGFPAGGFYGNIIPGPFTSTDSTGCLTVQFRTDNSKVDDGWRADVTCVDNYVCNLATSFSLTHESCYSCNNGSAEANVIGGIGQYIYEWSNGSTTANSGPLAPGKYYFKVTDNEICTFVDSITINPYVCPGFTVIPKVEDVLCFDECNGVVDFALSNGSQNFQVLWADGTTENIREDLCVGTYQITVTDVDNCNASDSVKVYQPEAFLLDSIYVVSSIDGSSGSITIHFTGSQGSITWSLNGMEYVSNDSMSFNQIVFSGLTPECYIVTGVDASGCKLVTDSICIENISGIENFDNFKFSIFPNPAVDLIYIGNTPNLKSFSIRIIDMFGTILHTSENQQMVNISTLNPGIYFLTISTNHEIFSQKLIKI
jgi:hypothetical protein